MAQYQKIVVTAFILHQGKVLVVRRSQNENFFPGVFEMPGGKVDFGENPTEALAREVQEETNLEIEILQPFYTFSYVSENAEGERHTVEIVYLTKLLSDPEAVKLSEDHDEYKWVSPEEISGNTEQILEIIKKGFELFLEN